MTGRPLKYTSEKELQKDIDKYIKSCYVEAVDRNGEKLKDQNGEQAYKQIKPFTLSGLAYAIGLDRKTLYNYSNKDDFFPTIKKYRDMCEAYAEETMFFSRNPAGVIFALKNNYNWTDKHDVTVNDGEKIREAYLKHMQNLEPNAQDD